MNNLRAALSEARTAAVTARLDPSDANVHMARSAVAALAVWRTDARGYNPNRAHNGQFGSGPHKLKPRSEAVESAAASVKHHEGRRTEVAAKLAGAKSAKLAAVAEARGHLAAARSAAALARSNPSAINVKAAKIATARAGESAAKVKQHSETIKQHTAAHAEARTAHIEAKKQLATARRGGEAQHVQPRAPKTSESVVAPVQVQREPTRTAVPSARPAAPSTPAVVPVHSTSPAQSSASSVLAEREAVRLRIADGIKGNAEGAHIDPATQAALRDSSNRIMAAYGVTPRLTGYADSRTVHTVSVEDMGGGYGQMWSEHTQRPGLMTISHQQAALLKDHMQLDQAGLHDLAQRSAAGHDDAYFKLFAAHTMHHETMHSHGPSIEEGIHRSTVEELTTEMSARRITADMHGVPSHGEAVNMAYDHIIDPVVAHAASTAGVSRERAYEAIEHASLSLKRTSGRLTDDEAIGFVANKAAEHLGAPHVAAQIATKIYQTSNKIRTGQ